MPKRQTPIWQYPSAAERTFMTRRMARMRAFLVRLRRSPEFQSGTNAAAVERTFLQLVASVTEASAADAFLTSASVIRFNQREGRKLAATLKRDLRLPGTELAELRLAWLSTTANDFSALLRSVRDETETAVAVGKVTTVTQALELRMKLFVSRAASQATDQITTLNGRLTRTLQGAMGVERFIWRTRGDAKVRLSHAANDGQTFSWAQPPILTGYPGEEFNCRCWPEPIGD